MNFLITTALLIWGLLATLTAMDFRKWWNNEREYARRQKEDAEAAKREAVFWKEASDRWQKKAEDRLGQLCKLDAILNKEKAK